MKIAIVGAGGIGGYVGVKLALSGEDVTFIVRGANLEAIRKNGMKLIEHDGTEQVVSFVRATNSYEEAGQQDLVILALKAHQVEAVMNDVPKQFGHGCVVNPASELIEPGVVRHIEGERFPIGELDGSSSDRVNRISECFTKAGFKAPVLDNIRSEIWLMLWGNLTFNPISALAQTTQDNNNQNPHTRKQAANMM